MVRATEAGPSSGRYSEEFLDETIDVWQPYFPHRKLSREDARETIVLPASSGCCRSGIDEEAGRRGPTPSGCSTVNSQWRKGGS
jgi:hypothetical protein